MYRNGQFMETVAERQVINHSLNPLFLSQLASHSYQYEHDMISSLLLAVLSTSAFYRDGKGIVCTSHLLQPSCLYTTKFIIGRHKYKYYFMEV